MTPDPQHWDTITGDVSIKEPFTDFSGEQTFITPPPPIWKWDLLGDGFTLIIHTPRDLDWFARLRCRIFLGSKFIRIKTE